jgi:YD repeat-containing protein
VRNGFGEIILRASPDSGTTVYVRDARGLVTQITDVRSVVVNMTYDDAGRITAKSFPAATSENVTYNGSAQLIIRVITNSGALNGTTHYVHDGKGNVIAEADSSGNTLREYCGCRGVGRIALRGPPRSTPAFQANGISSKPACITPSCRRACAWTPTSRTPLSAWPPRTAARSRIMCIWCYGNAPRMLAH